nr:PREDICTED: zona pellucida sperm-binding protein 4-like [Latimeria chalumnae]|eukprot:XP_014346962.1 PREDICTED: zona pellucida sperm-binding protein 4-like [Latimeria chalumnae]
MFRFTLFPEVYLHCRVSLCKPKLPPGPFSCITCPSAKRRLQRSAASFSDAYEGVLTYGPIKLLMPSDLTEGLRKPDYRLMYVPATVAAAAIGILFILVAVAKSRRKGSFW